jgi:transposase
MIKSRMMRWAGHIQCMGEMRNAYRILVWKPEETIQKSWEDYVKMDLRETGWKDVDWIRLVQGRDW